MLSDFANVPMTSTNSGPVSPKEAGYLAEPMKVFPASSGGCKMRSTAPVFLPMQLPEKSLHFEDDEVASPKQDPGSPGSVMSRNGVRVHFPPGLAPPDDTPSHGSALHAQGNCKPCAWYWKAGSCQNGKECLHCHLCPKDELKSRKKAKSAFMRLGLTSPKPAPEERAQLALSTFCVTEQAEVTSEPGSTAAATSESDITTPRTHMAAQVQAQAFAKPSSEGSLLHGTGECRPCAWFWKPTGCMNGKECRHCHECPPGEVKSRKKGKMAMLRLGLATPKADGDKEWTPILHRGLFRSPHLAICAQD